MKLRKILCTALALVSALTMSITSFASQSAGIQTSEVGQVAVVEAVEIGAADIAEGEIVNSAVKAAAHIWGAWKSNGDFSEVCQGVTYPYTHYVQEYTAKCTHTLCFSTAHKFEYDCGKHATKYNYPS